MRTADPTAPRQMDYLDGVARSAVGRTYKETFLAALDLRPGHTVIDVGCGPGTDLAHLAHAVTSDGTVIGVDQELDLVAEAQRRLADHSHVQVHVGDAYDLPLDDASVDRARIDRVLQHLEHPAQAVAELRRVTRSGGLVGLAEPDWDTLAIDSADVTAGRTLARFIASRVRHPTMGRQLIRLATGAGLTVRSLDAIPVVFRDAAAAEQILGLHRNVARAVQADLLTPATAQQLLDEMAAGPFVAFVMLVVATAQA